MLRYLSPIEPSGGGISARSWLSCPSRLSWRRPKTLPSSARQHLMLRGVPQPRGHPHSDSPQICRYVQLYLILGGCIKRELSDSVNGKQYWNSMLQNSTLTVLVQKSNKKITEIFLATFFSQNLIVCFIEFACLTC